MQNDAALSALSRDELEQLVSIYAKNWLAMDGYWFQAVERKRGMDEAMEHDVAVWQGFTRTEARRIRALLRLPEQAGLDGLEKNKRIVVPGLWNRFNYVMEKIVPTAILLSFTSGHWKKKEKDAF